MCASPPLGTIKSLFDRYFDAWKIVLPPENLHGRRSGRILQEGWYIVLRFGARPELEFLDVYAAHRMTNPRHFRIYEDGSSIGLPVQSDMLIYPVGTSEEQLQRMESEDERYNTFADGVLRRSFPREDEETAEARTETLFDEALAFIKLGYEAFELQLGWRFLYSSRSTLSPSTRLMLVGLNPAGSEFISPSISSEDGNLFLLRDSDIASSRYRDQVRELFALLAQAGAGRTAEELSKATLTLNYCPFRSRSWAELASRGDVSAFCGDLWALLAAELRPTVIICLSHEAAGLIAKRFGLSERKHVETRDLWIGWGNQKIMVRTSTTHGSAMLLIGIPHPSRFPIFGKSQYADVTHKIAELVVRRLKLADEIS